jgi:predicted glycogen debranching enzyme
MAVDLGRDLCSDLATAEAREWLVTNGLGGFACGTVAGLPTRRYHGLLVASFAPPVRRQVLVSKFDEIVSYLDGTYELGATRWRDGTIAPHGYRYIQDFRLDGSVPVWTFAFADALLEKRIWMEQGENTTYVTYTLARASAHIELRVKALSDWRDFHTLGHAGGERTLIERINDGICVHAQNGAGPSYAILSTAPIARDTHEWYVGIEYAQERARGLDDVGDVLHAGNFTAELNPGETLSFTLSTKNDASLDTASALARRQARDDERLRAWGAVHPHAGPHGPAWIRTLVLAADQFVVQRTKADGTSFPSIIAGYPWFADWGRDTMTSLPGLLLRTGRADVAASLLRAFAGVIDQGMLPNYFPDDGGAPQYNTVDGSLLFIDALHRYVKATNDRALLGELFDTVDAIVAAYRGGTRYGIRADVDGLLYAGADGVQLTWMDARVGDVVVTQRRGKPVEINALWYHALAAAAEFAGILGRDARPYESLASRVKAAFDKFWDPSEGYCFDVIDGPHGNDASLRPNQLFAVALPHRALSDERSRSVVAACTRALLTPAGLRTLAPDAPGYRGDFGGSASERDGAYHQGTVWPWLIGPFVAAALNVGVDRATAMSYLLPVARSISAYGLGSLPEIATGDAPFSPAGCFAQAWSVGCALDAWALLAEDVPRA